MQAHIHSAVIILPLIVVIGLLQLLGNEIHEEAQITRSILDQVIESNYEYMNRS